MLMLLVVAFHYEPCYYTTMCAASEARIGCPWDC